MANIKSITMIKPNRLASLIHYFSVGDYIDYIYTSVWEN